MNFSWFVGKTTQSKCLELIWNMTVIPWGNKMVPWRLQRLLADCAKCPTTWGWLPCWGIDWCVWEVPILPVEGECHLMSAGGWRLIRCRLRGMLQETCVELSLVIYVKDGSFGAFHFMCAVLQPMGSFLPCPGPSHWELLYLRALKVSGSHSWFHPFSTPESPSNHFFRFISKAKSCPSMTRCIATLWGYSLDLGKNNA